MKSQSCGHFTFMANPERMLSPLSPSRPQAVCESDCIAIPGYALGPRTPSFPVGKTLCVPQDLMNPKGNYLRGLQVAPCE